MTNKEKTEKIIEIMGLDPKNYTGVLVFASDKDNSAHLLSGLPLKMAEDVSVAYFDDEDVERILDVFIGFVQYKKQTDTNIKGLFGNQETGEA